MRYLFSPFLSYSTLPPHGSLKTTDRYTARMNERSVDDEGPHGVFSFPMEDFRKQPGRPSDHSRCRICWEEFDDIDDTYMETFVAPCGCRGTLEYVHVECIARWSQHRHRRCRDECDVCKQRLDYPGMKQVHSHARRVWATNRLASTAIRLLQHYIVSLTLMGGLETAANSIMASMVAYKQQQLEEGEREQSLQHTSHVNNLLKAIMGISIARMVVCRRTDVVSHVRKVLRSVGWGGRIVGRVVSERLVI